MSTAVLPGQLALDFDTPHEGPEPLPAYVPTWRIRPHVEKWFADGGLLHDLADATSLAPETIRAISQGTRTLTRFRVADAIITKIDVWAWHRPPEAGGLADLYASPLATTTSSRGTGAAAAPRPLTPR